MQEWPVVASCGQRWPGNNKRLPGDYIGHGYLGGGFLGGDAPYARTTALVGGLQGRGLQGRGLQGRGLQGRGLQGRGLHSRGQLDTTQLPYATLFPHDEPQYGIAHTRYSGDEALNSYVVPTKACTSPLCACKARGPCVRLFCWSPVLLPFPAAPVIDFRPGWCV